MQRSVRIEDFNGSIESVSDEGADRVVHEPLGLVGKLPCITYSHRGGPNMGWRSRS